MIVKDTVEEKILKLQERKKKLVTEIVSEDSAFLKSLTKDDVISLFFLIFCSKIKLLIYSHQKMLAAVGNTANISAGVTGRVIVLRKQVVSLCKKLEPRQNLILYLAVQSHIV